MRCVCVCVQSTERRGSSQTEFFGIGDKGAEVCEEADFLDLGGGDGGLVAEGGGGRGALGAGSGGGGR